MTVIIVFQRRIDALGTLYILIILNRLVELLLQGCRCQSQIHYLLRLQVRIVSVFHYRLSGVVLTELVNSPIKAG